LLIKKNMKKKLRILAAADLHGSKDIARTLAKKAKKEQVDLVILAGDIAGLAGRSEEVLEPFKTTKQKLLFIPGNWDSDEDLEHFTKKGKNIDHYYVTYEGIGILGVGCKDWNITLGTRDKKRIEKNMSMMNTKTKILVSHLHAKGTKAEFSGYKGDPILRQAIKKHKPNILISAHIHEAEGLEDIIGKTKIIQVGRKGTILEL
jgi:putative phosphoesterase